MTVWYEHVLILEKGIYRQVLLPVRRIVHVAIDCGCFVHRAPWRFELTDSDDSAHVRKLGDPIFRQMDHNGPIRMEIEKIQWEKETK